MSVMQELAARYPDLSPGARKRVGELSDALGQALGDAKVSSFQDLIRVMETGQVPPDEMQSITRLLGRLQMVFETGSEFVGLGKVELRQTLEIAKNVRGIFGVIEGKYIVSDALTGALGAFGRLALFDLANGSLDFFWDSSSVHNSFGGRVFGITPTGEILVGFWYDTMSTQARANSVIWDPTRRDPATARNIWNGGYDGSGDLFYNPHAQLVCLFEGPEEPIRLYDVQKAEERVVTLFPGGDEIEDVFGITSTGSLVARSKRSIEYYDGQTGVLADGEMLLNPNHTTRASVLADDSVLYTDDDRLYRWIPGYQAQRVDGTGLTHEMPLVAVSFPEDPNHVAILDTKNFTQEGKIFIADITSRNWATVERTLTFPKSDNKEESCMCALPGGGLLVGSGKHIHVFA